jgi:hypothetical protein
LLHFIHLQYFTNYYWQSLRCSHFGSLLTTSYFLDGTLLTNLAVPSIILSGQFITQSQSHFTADSQSVNQSVSQYVLASSSLCGRLTRYCFLFKYLGLEFVVLSLWGGLSDERQGLSLVGHSLVICLCVHLLFTCLYFTSLPYIHTIQYI